MNCILSNLNRLLILVSLSFRLAPPLALIAIKQGAHTLNIFLFFQRNLMNMYFTWWIPKFLSLLIIFIYMETKAFYLELVNWLGSQF